MRDIINTENLVSSDENTYSFQINLSENNSLNKFSKLLPIFYLSEKLQKTFKEELDLRDGLKLVINEYKPKKNLTVSFDIHNAPVEIAFCLNGRMTVDFETLPDENDVVYKDTLEVSKGSAAFFHLPYTKGKLSIFGNEKLTIISLHCSAKFISQFIDGESMLLSGGKIEISNNTIQKVFVELTSSNQQMTSLVSQIHSCNYRGSTKKMYLEAKAVELTALLLEHLKSQFIDENTFELTAEEVQRIRTIELILKNNLVEVPTLMDLASIAKMTHTKLNKGFRRVFGNTVFNHLRELRIQKAVAFLEEGKYNITQIAYETGWSSPSHFTKDFTAKFNKTPKQYQKEFKSNH